MHTSYITLVYTICLLICGNVAKAKSADEICSVTLTNNSGLAFDNRVVAIPWKHLSMHVSPTDTGNFKLVEAGTKKELVYQLAYEGKKEIQHLLVQVSLLPGKFTRLSLQKGRHGIFAPKTYGRFVPERKDDFAWENDKIAFRMYGKALESTPKENAYGIDVWVKRTDRMIINERYKKAEYHVDHGDGLDYYHVGRSLGAGNSAPFVNDSIWYSRNFTNWKLLDNGPLRTSFQLEYDAWDVAGQQVSAIKTITLDAGSQMNRISVQHECNGRGRLPVVIGIIKRQEPGTILLEKTV